MKANTNYSRVFPRDLFNEAKLLKCMGLLCLKILDNKTPVKMENEDSGEAPIIGLLDEGALTIVNLNVSIKGKIFPFKTIYNSKATYPLYLEYEYVDYLVFDESGEFSEEFIGFCKTVK